MTRGAVRTYINMGFAAIRCEVLRLVYPAAAALRDGALRARSRYRLVGNNYYSAAPRRAGVFSASGMNYIYIFSVLCNSEAQ